MSETNWGGTLTFGAKRIERPTSIDQLRDLVLAQPLLKPLGTRHSFSTVADAPGGIQLDLADLPSPIAVEADTGAVTIGAATTYGQLLPVLAEHGRTLPALASLPHCTVAGSVATGTHGSGSRVLGLAGAVTEIELLTSDGELHTIGSTDPRFAGAVINIGALGVVTRLTLQTVPQFDVRQDAFEPLSWANLVEHATDILDLAYSVSIFTRWTGDDAGHVVLKERADEAPAPADLFGALPAGGPRHPVHRLGVAPLGVTPQGGRPGPAADRLPHFELAFTPSSGSEVQSEYFVDRRDASAAIEALHRIGRELEPLLFVSEIRSIAADDLWLSPAYGRDTVAFHFTWRPEHAAVERAARRIEEVLEPFAPRPHWGKVFSLDQPLHCYPRLEDFARVRAELDPVGRFCTPFVRAVLGLPMEATP